MNFSLIRVIFIIQLISQIDRYYYNLIINSTFTIFTLQMKQKQQVNKPAPSFLDKFKGKQSILSKQGLIDLFQKKKLQIQSKANSQPTLAKQDKINSLKIKLKQLQKVRKIDLEKRQLRKGSVDNINKSTQIQNGPKRLPSLQKSISHTQPLHKKSVQFPQKQVIRTSNSVHGINKIKQKQRDFPLKFQLDKYALNHLEFLNKFQEKILMREKRKQNEQK